MEVTAHLRNLRQSPTKVRLVIDLVRGMDAGTAVQQLRYVQKRAALPVAKLIQSAMANAEHNFKLDPASLMIKEIRADEGTVLKRWQPKAFGSAGKIRKRNSHITVVLSQKTIAAKATKQDKVESGDINKKKSAPSSKGVKTTARKSKAVAKAS
jgi:large subunit ribosomal protein L22